MSKISVGRSSGRVRRVADGGVSKISVGRSSGRVRRVADGGMSKT
jgi:hypothetical protein